jgi:hypothetical protein
MNIRLNILSTISRQPSEPIESEANVTPSVSTGFCSYVDRLLVSRSKVLDSNGRLN